MGSLKAVRANLPKVGRESGVSGMKISKLLFSKGICSNLVQTTFLSLEIDIRPIFGVLATFRGFVRISTFFSYSSHMVKYWPIWAKKGSELGQNCQNHVMLVRSHNKTFFQLSQRCWTKIFLKISKLWSWRVTKSQIRPKKESKLDQKGPKLCSWV